MSKVDSREPEDIKRVFTKAGWQCEALQAGDYELRDCINQIILIERKSLDQFLTDHFSGQLQRQCLKMKEAGDGAILLIEGHLKKDNGWLLDSKGKSRLQWHDFWKVIYSLRIDYTLTTSISDTIERLFKFEEYLRKELHQSTARVLSQDPYIATLCNVYGISTVKAGAIKEAMPQLVGVANASVEELESILGIGGKLARRIYEFWRS